MTYLERTILQRARGASASLGLALVSAVRKVNDPRTLYVCRPLLNAGALRRWALAAELPNVEPAEEMHVTIAFSRAPVRWLDVGASYGEELIVGAGGPRILERLGPWRTTVGLAFLSDELAWRHEQIKAAGASWDFPSYIPHVTVAKDVPLDFDLSTLVPFRDRLIFGPERFEEIDESKVAKGGGWSKQPRVPTGPKGGQWTAGGGFGVGAGSKPLDAAHMGVDDLAAHRFSEDKAQRGFMKPLTQSELTGKPPYLDNPYGFVLQNAKQPSDVRFNDNPEDVATFSAGVDPGSGLNGVAFKPWDGPPGGDFSKVDGTGNFAEPPLPKAGAKRLGAGVIIEEADGRLWTVNPTNNFGSYEETFPKGGIEPGLNLRQTAIKEAWEESGLKVELTGYIGDFERTTSVARYYRARRVGGSPVDFHWETAATNAVPLDNLKERLNHPNDKAILAALSGEPAQVVKAALALADLVDLLGLQVLYIAKKAWSKQPRVPAGLATGGQWSKGAYGSGAYGALFAEGGVPLQLQKYNGTGPQADKLNAAIGAMEKAANVGIGMGPIMNYAAKPKPVQTYSAAQWESAQEAVAYFQAKAGHAAEKKANADYAAKPKPSAPPPTPAGTPSNPLKLSQMTKVGAKGGSNPGGTYKDADGQTWVVKSYKTSEHAYNEVAAANAYAYLGAKAPEMKLIDLEGQYQGGLGVASKMIGDLKPLDMGNPAHVKAAQADFATHALLANWDAIGLSHDNTLIDGKGVAHMVDPGGALLYRAMGVAKGSEFSDKVVEIETMRDPLGKNPEAASVYGKMTASEIADSMQAAVVNGLNGNKLTAGFEQAIRDAYPPGHPAAQKTIDKLTARTIDLKNQMQAIGADVASTSTLDIAQTGTQTGLAAHPDPNVQTLIGVDVKAIDAQIQQVNTTILDSVIQFEGKSAGFYTKSVNTIDALATNGDLEGVKAAFYNKPSPTKNYSNYLKAYNAALNKAQLIAAKNAKLQGKPGDGSLITGAAKVTAIDIDTAKQVTGDQTITGMTAAGAAVINETKASAPKPEAKAPLSPPPAMPMDPKLASGKNKPVSAHVALVDQVKTLVASGNSGAVAQIQGLATTVKGTNTYAQNLKNWMGNVVAAMGGQHAVDVLPNPVKVKAMEAGITAGAKVSTMGHFKVTETETVIAFDPKSIPDPPDFLNWKGQGQGLSSKPELNAYNDAQSKAMHALALKNDLAGVMKIEAAPGTAPNVATHLKAYKASLIGTLQLVGTKTVSKEVQYAGGGKIDAGRLAKEIGAQFVAKQNWDASAAEKFGEHVVIGEVGKDIAAAVYDGLPKLKITKASAVTGKLLDQSHAAPIESQKAWAHHTTGSFSVDGSSWSGDVNELLKGKPGTAAHSAALQRAFDAEKGMYELPAGLTVSRGVNNGSIAQWKALEGKIINQPATTSTSINPSVWSGAISLKLVMGVGVKGAYVGAASKATSTNKTGKHQLGCGDEQELILPRNTKWMVSSVKQVGYGADDFFTGGGTVVEIVVLPNDPVMPPVQKVKAYAA